jgi:hypothetical protein
MRVDTRSRLEMRRFKYRELHTVKWETRFLSELVDADIVSVAENAGFERVDIVLQRADWPVGYCWQPCALVGARPTYGGAIALMNRGLENRLLGAAPPVARKSL